MTTKITKDTFLRRIWKVVKMLSNLEEKQFDYSDYVAEFKVVDNIKCGTVCCTLGWYPEKMKQVGIAWDLDKRRSYRNEDDLPDLCVADPNDRRSVRRVVREYHGINKSIFKFLFQGYRWNLRQYLTPLGKQLWKEISIMWDGPVMFTDTYEVVIWAEPEVGSKLEDAMNMWMFLYYLVQHDYLTLSTISYE